MSTSVDKHIAEARAKWLLFYRSLDVVLSVGASDAHLRT